jgi:hypothetical protein
MDNKKIPKKIFIVPYRNRGPQLYFFCKWMNEFILANNENEDDYKIFFSHQNDNKVFNRGAIKNIGFIVAKKLYPDDYKNITFIFNDIDCLPYKKDLFDYETEIGTITHYYGFEHSLGGIVVIKGVDFQHINGFINLYTWGQEDRSLQLRCEKKNLIIDRTNFYKIGSKEILQLFDGVNRIINNKELNRACYDDGSDGISTLHNLFYTIDNTSKNAEDPSFIEYENTLMINIYNFSTKYNYDKNDFTNYDLRNPEVEIFKGKNKVDNFNDNDWTNIPLYSTINNTNNPLVNNPVVNNPLVNNPQQNNILNLYNPVKQENNQMFFRKINPNNKTLTAKDIYSSNFANQNNIKSRATTSIKLG